MKKIQDNATLKSTFASDVLVGLSSTPKSLPCKYFYDDQGSVLFERICSTPEYYVTRTELSLLSQVSGEVAELLGPSVDVIEPGAGVGEKMRVFMDALKEPRSFVPIDISEAALLLCEREARHSFPDVEIHPVCADFTESFELPSYFKQRSNQGAKRVIFFPGSTISNFAPDAAVSFLSVLRSILAEGDYLFIGVDRIKDVSTLERAYNDKAGITAEFNLNLLRRIRRELDTDLNPDLFEHVAFYNEAEHRIEMHLQSRIEHQVTLCGTVFSFAQGERIHTENSYKYAPDGVFRLADKSGFEVVRTYSDPQELFSLYLAEAC